MNNSELNNKTALPCPTSNDYLTWFRKGREKEINEAALAVGTLGNVAIVTPGCLTSYGIIEELAEKCKDQYPNWIGLHFDLLLSFRSFDMFIGRVLFTILYSLCKDRNEMERYLSEYFSDYKPVFRNSTELLIDLGKNPSETAEELFQVAERICHEKDQPIILFLDKVESIKCYKDYEEWLSFLRKRISQKSNIKLVTLCETLSVHKAVTEGANPIYCRIIDFIRLSKDLIKGMICCVLETNDEKISQKDLELDCEKLLHGLIF